MRDRLAPQRKKTTTPIVTNPALVSPHTPTLANPTRGFGLPPLAVQESLSRQEQQPEGEKSLEQDAFKQKPLGHDISRISLRPQTRMTVSSPGDAYEREADWMAQRVMRVAIPEPPTGVDQLKGEDILQSKCAASEKEDEQKEKLQKQPFLQRVANEGGVDVDSNLESQLTNSKGGGRPLAAEVRSFMEPRFGQNFSQVRVHTDSPAVQMNRALNAQAFTHGNHIYFGSGKNPAKDELTAHELTHVVQQTGGKQQNSELQRRLHEEESDKQEISPPNSQNHSNKETFQQPPMSEQLATAENVTQAPIKAQKISPPNSEDTANKETFQQPPIPEQQATDVPQGEEEQREQATSNLDSHRGQNQEPQTQKQPQPQQNNQQQNLGTAGKKSEGQTNEAASAAPLRAEDPGEILEQLKNTPPTQAFATYTQAATVSAQALEQQRQQLQATIPEIPAPTGLSPQTADTVANNAAPATAASKEQTAAKQAPKFVAPNLAAKFSPIGGLLSAIASAQSHQNSEQSRENTEETAEKTEESGENQEISIDAPERPKVNLTGDADPSQMDAEQTQSLQQVQAAKAQESSGISQDFGENNIFPKASNQTLKANKELSQVSPFSVKGGEMPKIPGEIIGSLNQGLTPYYQAKIAPEQQKYHQGKQQFDIDSGNARENSHQQIINLNQEAKQKQLEQQKQTQQEVAQARQDWQSELDNAEKDYQDKAGKASKEQQQKIDAEKARGEQEADQKITEAEQQAADKKKQAEEEAAKEKAKGERKSGWDHFVGFFQDVWDGITKAVNAIFDFVRNAIKAIFDAVKKVVTAIIDAVRNVIVGLIKAFGEILKGLVQIVFAAFPEISKKFCDAIDNAVNKAVEVVNSIADFLQKAVSTVLDFLANILDKLLGLVQGIFNGIMTVIGMIITGQFAELIQRFGNLIEGAKAMPPQFETAALEELMGGGELDLDKPLAPEELAQAPGVNIPGATGKDSPQTGSAAEMPQTPWTEENVGVDAVEENMELSPELAEQLMQQTQGEGEVILAESQDTSRSMDAIMSEATGQQQVGGKQEQQQYPDDGLTPKQRASIKWELMKQGIKQWFADNWPILLAALIGAAVVIIGLIIASGGAVLAALPVIMEILAIVFAAEAIAKIGGYLSDYLSKSWEGDIQGGGKSLAKALAAGAIELLMLLTFEAGKVAAKGVKAVAKGTAKVVSKVSRAVIKGVKYVIKKGKVLFKGIAGTGVGKQFKKIGELGEALLNRMRFKAFRIRVANRRFRLEGLINPWVLIAQGNIETEIKDAQGKPQTVDQTTPKATFITEDELKAVQEGGTPKTGKLTEYEVVPYKTATASGKGARGEVGDDLTGDHIPSRAALVKAEENKLGRKLTTQERNKIKDEGVTVVLKDKTHKELSRTYGSRNKSQQITGDANDLSKAFREDTEAIFEGLFSGKNIEGTVVSSGGELTPDIIGAYMRAYRENVRKGVFIHSPEADKMFMDYLNKVKTGTPPTSGLSSSGVGSKHSLPTDTSSPELKPAKKKVKLLN